MKQYNILVLEDDHNRVKTLKEKLSNQTQSYNFFVTEDVDQAIEWVKNFRFQSIFLDHDLGGQVFVDPTKEYNCGTTFVNQYNEMLLDNAALPLPLDIFVHTMNTPRGDYMSNVLKSNERLRANRVKIYQLPFAALISQLK